MRSPSIVLAIVLAACVPPRRAGVGTECEINSECAAPLVCRLGHCRNECATGADCPSGTSCVLDPNGFGACQLAAETSCTLASECPEGLICRFEQCTNPCETDRDCPGGARCIASPMGLACLDPGVEACNFDAECGPDPETGTARRCVGGRCRRECFTDRDCRNDFWCNGDQGGVCWPLPRLASADAGVRDGGGTDGGGPAACVPRRPTWTASQGGVDAATIVATGGGHLVLSGVTDPTMGPGGTLYDLDLTTRMWSEVPFSEAREGMTSNPNGTPSVYITGGSWRTPGGDPYLGVSLYFPPSGMLTPLAPSPIEARRGSTVFVCNTNLIVAGGTIFSPDEHLSSTVDELELTPFGRSLRIAMPEGRRGIGGASRGAEALLVGGERETAPGVFVPSDSFFVLDCITPAITTGTLPRPYRRAFGLSDGDRSYFVGEAEPLAGEGPYDHVEVYDWPTGTFSSLAAPPPADAEALTDAVLVSGRVYRSFGNVVQGLDLAGGSDTCLTPEVPAHRLASSPGSDVLLVISVESGLATVAAYDVP